MCNGINGVCSECFVCDCCKKSVCCQQACRYEGKEVCNSCFNDLMYDEQLERDWPIDTCPNCGGDMVGDGVTVVRHCENIELDSSIEPDASPVYCASLTCADCTEKDCRYRNDPYNTNGDCLAMK